MEAIDERAAEATDYLLPESVSYRGFTPSSPPPAPPLLPPQPPQFSATLEGACRATGKPPTPGACPTGAATAEAEAEAQEAAVAAVVEATAAEVVSYQEYSLTHRIVCVCVRCILFLLGRASC